MKVIVLDYVKKNFSIVNVAEKALKASHLFNADDDVEFKIGCILEEMGIDTVNASWMQVDDGQPVALDIHELLADQCGFHVQRHVSVPLDEKALAHECRRKLVAELLDVLSGRQDADDACMGIQQVSLVDGAGIGFSLSVLSSDRLFRLQACSLQRTCNGALFVNCRDPKVKDSMLTLPMYMVMEDDIRRLTEYLRTRQRICRSIPN